MAERPPTFKMKIKQCLLGLIRTPCKSHSVLTKACIEKCGLQLRATRNNSSASMENECIGFTGEQGTAPCRTTAGRM